MSVIYRVARQSKREEWKAQKTAGVLARVVLARLAISEIGLLAGCLGEHISPSRASAGCEGIDAAPSAEAYGIAVHAHVFHLIVSEMPGCRD